MELHCTRPSCPQPHNEFPDLDNTAVLKQVEQHLCQTCGMPLILRDRYLPQRFLGQGGFGATYVAIDRHSPRLRRCLVKQFRPASHLSKGAWEMAQRLFEREAKVLEELGNEHPQIPDLLASFSLQVPSLTVGAAHDELFYLVQEFIDGQTLEEQMQQHGPLAAEAMLNLFKDVLGILQFVHDRNVIHRDLKPSNLMRNQEGRLFLIDFGAVKEILASGGGTRLGGTRIGTPDYAAPEQLLGKKVFPATDLYSLAVTCLVLRSGRDPEELRDPDTHTWCWRSLNLLNEPIANLFEHLLQDNPADRPTSATAVLTELNQLSPQPPTPPHPTPITTTPTHPPTHPPIHPSPPLPPPTPQPPLPSPPPHPTPPQSQQPPPTHPPIHPSTQIPHSPTQPPTPHPPLPPPPGP